MAAYSRLSLQRLAQTKLDDAVLLLQHRRYSNAYYLGGYAAELGLKAAITRQFARDTLPDRKLVNEAYTHKLPELVRLAGLQPAMRASLDANPIFASNWGIVAAWEETSRYESIDEFKVAEFFDALVDARDGVFPWIITYW